MRGALWVALMAMLAVPLPLSQIPMPERGMPILYLIIAAALLLFIRISRASVPLALLLAYTLGHVIATGNQLRAIQLLLLMALCGLLFLEASALPERVARRCAWALVAGAGLQGALGVLNMFAIFPSPGAPLLALWAVGIDPAPIFKAWDVLPWMTLFSLDYVGRPAGWLTHPNYWGAYIGLSVPVVYALLGRWTGLRAFALCATSGSVWAIVSALVGLGIMAWRDLHPRLRVAFLVAAAFIVVATTVHHVTPRLSVDDRPLRMETLTSGRTNVWAAAWPRVAQHWLVGNGLGSWRAWGNEYNRRLGATYVTQQAHNEPLQLAFELGLIGLVLGAWTVVQLLRGGGGLAGGDRSPHHGMWLAVAAVALVNSFGSPTLHLPTQAGVALFAAGRVAARRG